MELSCLTLDGNRAFRFGGGIHAVAGSLKPIRMSGITVKNNTAMVGGGMSFYAIFLLEIGAHEGKPTSIIGNTASVGGGLYYRAIHLFVTDITVKLPL